jgi:hypothetical protein
MQYHDENVTLFKAVACSITTTILAKRLLSPSGKRTSLSQIPIGLFHSQIMEEMTDRSAVVR